jgi:hypothetical protein
VEWDAIIPCRHPSAPATLRLFLVEAKARVRDEALSRLEMRVNRIDKILGEVLQWDRDGRPSQGVRVRFRERASDMLSTVLGGEYEEVLLMPCLGFFYASVSRRLGEPWAKVLLPSGGILLVSRQSVSPVEEKGRAGLYACRGGSACD